MGIRMIFDSDRESGKELVPKVSEEKKHLLLSVKSSTGSIMTIDLNKKTAIRVVKHLRYLISEMED